MKNQETKTHNFEMTLKDEGFAMSLSRYYWSTDSSLKESKLYVEPSIENSFVNRKGKCVIGFNSKGEINAIQCGFTTKLKHPATHTHAGYISKTMAKILETYPDKFNDLFAECYELMKKDQNLEDEDDSDVLEDEE